MSTDFSLPLVRTASFFSVTRSGLLTSVISVALMGGVALAQATPPITPSGLGTQVNLSATPPAGGVQYDITGGTRPGGGPNLFHSFGEFGVPTNNIANFLNETPNLATANILGRVTGTNGNNPSLSSIYGTIQTTGFGNANLFLMNPAGFLFGPGATVNVGGMVAFTSADYLRLGDLDGNNAGIFHADSTQASVLTSVPVASFGFLGSNPGAITVQGSQFTVTEGTGISLVGGNIEVTADTLDDGTTVQLARLAAPVGQINLASVTSPGEVLATNFLPEPGMTRGTINLSQGSTLDVSSDSAGTIRIRGGQFVMDNATILVDTVNAYGAPVAVDINLTGDLTISDTRGVSAITARTTGLGNAGEVRITSTNLEATSSAESLFDPIDTHFAFIDTHTSSSGTAGSVSIETTGNLNVTGQPTGPLFFIDSGTVGPDGGHGGDVTMTAENIRLQNANISTGDFIAWNSLQDSAGSGGTATITADTLSMTRSVIATDGYWAGRAGDLTINVREINMNTFSGLSLLEDSGGGKLTINADRLIADSAQFHTETVFGAGGGFNITAKVVELKNGTTLQSQTAGDGDAGDIRITATDHLTLEDRFGDPNDLTTFAALIRPTGLYTNSVGTELGNLGNAGSVIVSTPRLEVLGGARINTNTLSNGRGGDVIVTATNQITISGERPIEIVEEASFGLGSTRASGIYTRTVGSEFCTGACGDAGRVSITTGSLTLSDGAVINSGTTSTGLGGDVTLHATDTISISGTMADGTSGGAFSQTVGTDPGSGNGGNIALIAGQSVTISDGASISASSTGPGNTGNIQIDAGNQFAMTNSTVTTQADAASGGTIKITTTPSGTVQLTNSTISASVLDGTGGGGSVNIDPQFVILQNSQILATATQGPGGNIFITTNLLLPDANSVISASSQFGVNGTVTIQSPNAPGAGEIIPLSQEPLLPTSLLTQRCAALAGGQFSSFTVAGRDSLPTEPGSWLASPLAFATLSEGSGLGMKAEGGKLQMPILSLRQIAPAGFLTQAFALDWSAGCQS